MPARMPRVIGSVDFSVEKSDEKLEIRCAVAVIVQRAQRAARIIFFIVVTGLVMDYFRSQSYYYF